MKIAMLIKSLFLFLSAVQISIAGKHPAPKEPSDSLKTKIQKEVSAFPIEAGELFTDATGLKPIVDSAYPHLNKIPMRPNNIGFRYPILLNEALFNKNIQANKQFIAMKNSSKRMQNKPDSTADENRFMLIRLFDDTKISVLFDDFYNSMAYPSQPSETWIGHAVGFPGSRVVLRIGNEKNGIAKLQSIKIEGVGHSYSYQEYVSTNTPWFSFREANYAPMLGPEDGIPENQISK